MFFYIAAKIWNVEKYSWGEMANITMASTSTKLTSQLNTIFPNVRLYVRECVNLPN